MSIIQSNDLITKAISDEKYTIYLKVHRIKVLNG